MCLICGRREFDGKNVPPFSVAYLIKYSHFTIWCIVKKSCKIGTMRMTNSVDDFMSPLQILVSTSHKTYLVINIFSRVKFVVKRNLALHAMLKAHGKMGTNFSTYQLMTTSLTKKCEEVAQNDLGNECCALLFHNVLGRGRMHA